MVVLERWEGLNYMNAWEQNIPEIRYKGKEFMSLDGILKLQLNLD